MILNRVDLLNKNHALDNILKSSLYHFTFMKAIAKNRGSNGVTITLKLLTFEAKGPYLHGLRIGSSRRLSTSIQCEKLVKWCNQHIAVCPSIDNWGAVYTMGHRVVMGRDQQPIVALTSPWDKFAVHSLNRPWLSNSVVCFLLLKHSNKKVEVRANSHTRLKACGHCNLRALIGRKGIDRLSLLHTRRWRPK